MLVLVCVRCACVHTCDARGYHRLSVAYVTSLLSPTKSIKSDSFAHRFLVSWAMDEASEIASVRVIVRRPAITHVPTVTGAVLTALAAYLFAATYAS